MSFVRIENLEKSYGINKAVKKISFEIQRGELFGLLGPNGAGKSTTISMICGLLKPDTGNIYIKDMNIQKEPLKSKKLLGLVPQEIALYPTLTAEENLNFWGRMYDLSGNTLRDRIKATLDIVGLTDRKNEAIKTYSGGMKRRINIAAALLHKPEILIMDEPTVGIDPQSRNHILETVKKLNEEGMTVIYTSHYMEEVEYLCNRIGIIDHGNLMAIGEKDELKRSIIDQDRIEIELSSVTPTVVESVKELPGILEVTSIDKTLQLYSKNASELLSKVLSTITGLGVRIISLKVDEPNLESVFLKLTGRALRD